MSRKEEKSACDIKPTVQWYSVREVEVKYVLQELRERKQNEANKRRRKDERKVPKRLPLRPCRLLVFPPESEPEL